MAAHPCRLAPGLFKRLRKCEGVRAPQPMGRLAWLPLAVAALSLVSMPILSRLTARRIGDVVNCLTLLNTVVFTGAVLVHSARIVDFGFSDSFSRDGFW